MESNPGKDRIKADRKPSLEKLIDAIDQKVDQVPTLSAAESFAALLGGRAEDYQRLGEQYVRFIIDGRTFAIPMGNTLEIDYVPDIVPLPNIPQWILGICSLRGEIVSVVDLRQIFGMTSAEVDTAKKLILIKNKNISIAFPVDSVSGMLLINDSDKQDETDSETKKAFSKFVKDVIRAGRQKVHLLDLDALMAAIKI